MEKAKQEGNGLMEKYKTKLQENNVRLPNSLFCSCPCYVSNHHFIQHIALFCSLQISGEAHTMVGKPGECIIACAEKYNANQIVMGTRGFGIVRRTILGSVSEYVIHHSKVPVTVVPRETQHIYF